MFWPLKDIPLFKKGETRTLVISTEANNLVAVLNAVRRLEIKRGATDKVILSPEKIVIQIKRSSSDGTSSQYRGNYAADGVTEFGSGGFTFGDIVRVSPENVFSTTLDGPTIPGVYICVKDNPTTIDQPRHPLQDGGETEFWQWLSTWPSQRTDCSSGESQTVVSDTQDLPEE